MRTTVTHPCMQVSKLRKYASMLDVLPSALEGKLHLVTYANRSIFATFTAMSAHNSQWRWCVPCPTASRRPAGSAWCCSVTLVQPPTACVASTACAWD